MSVRSSSGKRIWIFSELAATVLVLFTMMALSISSLPDTRERIIPEEHTHETSTPARTDALTVHDPIVIDGNSGFTNASGVVWGSGTVSDPYLIENWDINASSADGIHIWNTDAHFIVRDCYVHDGEPNYHGIHLYNCANGSVCNTTCAKDLWGIYLYLSNNNTLKNNNCSDNEYGIRIYASAGNTLSNNTCQNNQIGMVLFYPSNSTFSNNDCSSNDDYGVYIQSSEDNILSNNTCSSNNGYGMCITYSGNTTLSGNVFDSNGGIGILLDSTRAFVITNCTISNNTQYGLYIYGEANSTDNWVWNNTFYHNNGADDVYDPFHIQAYDNGTDNRWNSTDGYGNYWSDWTTPDLDGDGIVEGPYLIAGDAGAEDNRPQTTVQTQIPEFGMMSAMPVAIIMTIVLIRKMSSRKGF